MVNLAQTLASQELVVFNVWMIHKIEIFPHYTYPLPDGGGKLQLNLNANDSLEQSERHPGDRHNQIAALDSQLTCAIQCSHQTSSLSSSFPTRSTRASPYRTCSHYGFNYPMTYQPNITIHPAHLLTAVQLQREKVIAFIKSTAMSLNTGYFQPREHYAPLQPRAPRLKSRETPLVSVSKQRAGAEHVTVHNDDDPQNIDSNGSYISVKEIKLEPTKRRRSSKMVSDHEYDSVVGDPPRSVYERELHTPQLLTHEHHQQDSLSEQFSSLLSIGGTSYPAGSHSHTADLAHDHEQESIHQQHYDDSGDNNSSICTRPTSTTQRASYVLRDFLPAHAQAQAQAHDAPEHKPESEQELHHTDTTKFVTSTPMARQLLDMRDGGEEESDDARLHAHHSHKQIKLTLNSKALKRRCSYSPQEAAGSVGPPHDRYRHVTASLSEADSSSPTSSLRSLEIHININVKNSDCARTLQTHETEFRRKLERIIDEEINLIAQQLSGSAQSTATNNNMGAVHNEPTESSLLEMATNGTRHLLQHTTHAETWNDLRLAGNHLASGQQRCKSSKRTQLQSNSKQQQTKPPPPSATVTAASSCCAEADSTAADTPPPDQHRQLIAVLEQELESLLNGIICANALHNHAVMCDCKMKVAQISEELRASLNASK